ncbi:hypothetical protein [Methylorubrum thiocyanatum]|uniref:Uncharacterized protein n=1 Tax=Methylorubrum thiocyanatum TaxID=47958 RepID=A0AA40S080_9HYPH|nr:hypothetical protein [Methylorubrum thiocyanatum]MBA8912218.1 hypothetical protein [Methylorubrum thiocyanatum]GJE83206.1 hypothetical protein CJNNKLLH_4575 [Methylorubrum thiocyanatum]
MMLVQAVGMGVRISLADLEMTWRAVDEAAGAGRGALERTAVAFGVRRAVVMAAIDRVEAAVGDQDFFDARVRRSGALTAAGHAFHRKAPALIRAWKGLMPPGVK